MDSQIIEVGVGGVLALAALGRISGRSLGSERARRRAGEVAEADALAVARRLGAAAVFSSARLPGYGGDIDLSIIGPMAAVVEVKSGGASGTVLCCGDGRIRVLGGRPGRAERYIGGGKDIRSQVRKEAMALSGVTRTPTQAVVCITNATAIALEAGADWSGVTVSCLDRPLEHAIIQRWGSWLRKLGIGGSALRSALKHSPAVIDPENVDAVVASITTLDASIRRQDALRVRTA